MPAWRPKPSSRADLETRRAPRRWPSAIALLLCALPLHAGRAEPSKREYEVKRRQMVARQLEARGIRDRAVLRAMKTVPRERFVPRDQRRAAYEDRALAIGEEQTISQPYVVAAMTQALRPKASDRILEVGTGSGYQAAVLAQLVAEVHSIEIVPSLAETARRVLSELGYDNVRVIVGDGFGGLPEQAPFDGIMVTAAPAQVPAPLLQQLKVGGRLVIPVGEREQTLQVHTRVEDGFEVETLFDVRFVPMTGRAQEEPNSN